MNAHGRLNITIKSGTLSGANHIYSTDQSILIGKDRSCTLVLSDRGVSRKHCSIQADNFGWKILDLESTNGISVRGIPVGGAEDKSVRKAILLKSGDEIEVGEVRLHIEIESSSEEFTELLVPKSMGGPESVATEIIVPNRSGLPSVANPMNQIQTKVIQSASEKEKLKRKKASQEAAVATPKSLLNPLLDTPAIVAPRAFRNYQLKKKIGSGGMGDVFLATEQGAEKKERAIKFLRPQSDQTSQDRARFLREMEITFSMQHTALIRCVDCGEEESHLFIVMDYCSGGNLHELFERSGKLTVRRAIRLMDRLLSGIEYAHSMGIVHRDLKPSNILLHRDSTGKYQPKISDFGLAKSYLQAGDSGMTVNGSVGGSWAYMPREQLTNFRFVSPQCDVWSLGAILYECLTMLLPRPHEKGSDPIRTILHSEIVPIEKVMPDVHPALAKLLKKSLEREPDDRFKDAAAMRIALQKVAEITGVEL